MKDVAVLTWLLRTGLEPFRYLSENLQVMRDAVAAGRRTVAEQHPARSATLILWREFLRLLFLYPLLLSSFILVAAFLSQVKDLAGILTGLQGNYLVMLEGIGIALRLAILASLASYFYDWPSWRRYRLAKNDAALRYSARSLLLAIILAATLLVVPAWVVGAWHLPAFFASGSPRFAGYGRITMVLHNLLPIWDQAWQKIATWPSWIYGIGHWLLVYLSGISLLVSPFSSTKISVPLAELGIAAFIRNFLINYVGDVAIYTNLNQRAANFKIRAQILEECGHAVTSLYDDLLEEAIDQRALGGKTATRENRDAVAKTLTADHFQIVIAAHSLGTVIAYDTINDLFNRARIAAPAPGAKAAPGKADPAPLALDICKHLRGLLTFGSPLNKTYYFFRDESQAQELVRAQLIDQLHSFRLLAPTGKIGNVEVKPVKVAAQLRQLATNFRWLNVWAQMDPISGKIFFYDLPDADQLKRWYWKPILAHLSYWTDPEMYDFFASNLLT
jgi:hypothetical protein